MPLKRIYGGVDENDMVILMYTGHNGSSKGVMLSTGIS
jgi:hypothetical protein